MLNSLGPTPSFLEGHDGSNAIRDEDIIDTARLGSFLRLLGRQVWLIGLCVILAAVAGFVTLLLVPPMFTATVSLVLDNRKLQIFPQQPVTTDVSLDLPMTETQIEIIGSEEMAKGVVERLSLEEDPEFTQANLLTNVKAEVSRLLQLSPPTEDDDDRGSASQRRAVRHLRENLEVHRVGRTYVIEVSFKSRSAKKSARVANALAQAYIQSQVNWKDTAAKGASIWLTNRVNELQDKATAADRAAQELRADNKASDFNTAQEARVNLRLMETAAQAYWAAYNSHLQKLLELSNQPSFPEARVITAAAAVSAPRSPAPLLTLIASVALGAFLGVLAALWRDAYTTVERSRLQHVKRL
jgi:polysaccharide biosynthesis transport protein